MQLTSLNKTINLLIIGAFGLLNAFWLDNWFCASRYYKSFITDNQIIQNQAFWGAIFVPLIIFLGMLIDTTGGLIREIFKKITFSKKFLIIFYSILGVNQDFSLYSFWKKRLESRISERLSEDVANNGMGTTLFFENAQGPSVEWVISHYVAYLMAKGFLTILAVDLIFFIVKGALLKAVIILVMIYLLVRQSLGKFYYAYSILYRISDFHASKSFEHYEKIKTEE